MLLPFDSIVSLGAELDNQAFHQLCNALQMFSVLRLNTKFHCFVKHFTSVTCSSETTKGGWGGGGGGGGKYAF